MLVLVLCASSCVGARNAAEDVAGKAVQLAEHACRFRPELETVRDILKVGRIAEAASIAAAICEAVQAARQAGAAQSVPRVDGVTIRGRFLD